MLAAGSPIARRERAEESSARFPETFRVEDDREGYLLTK
jgi:hypothetical protein